MTQTQFVQSDLRFLLPIQPGHQVTILGHAPELATGIANAGGITTIVLSEDSYMRDYSSICHQVITNHYSLPLATASIDHMLIPMIVHRQAARLYSEVGRVLKPEGWLFLGMRNRISLHSLDFRYILQKYKSAKNRQTSLSVRTCRYLLERNNLRVESYYGVYEDLRHPQYLVSLDHANAAHYFFEQIFTPHSWYGALLQRLAIGLTHLNKQSITFKDIGILAQRVH
jgi:hypothetical protein